MRKILVFLILLITIPCCTLAAWENVEELEAKMNIDIDTANVATLKAIIEAYDEELSVYYDLIDKCLRRLELLGEERWVVEYRGVPEDASLAEMSFDELVALRDQINLAIWRSKEWQEVTVPDGIWEIGTDIPAGTWEVTVTGKQYLWIRYGDRISSNGMDVSASSLGLLYQKNIAGSNSIFHSEGESSSIVITLEEGFYFQVDGGSVVFTPYTGKPSLGFK